MRFKTSVTIKSRERNMCALMIFKSLNLEGKEPEYVLLKTHLGFSGKIDNYELWQWNRN